MTGSDNQSTRNLSVQDELSQAMDNMCVDQYLEMFHADFDPIYSMLTDYECAAINVETKFNILNKRLSIQG